MLEVSFAAALFGGLISFLSPCVLPLVPPYLSYLAGVTLDEMQARDDWAVRRRAILTALLFVAGFTTVFVLLGATASALGNVVRQHIGLLSTLAGAAIIVMGLHFMGLFRIGIPFPVAALAMNPFVALLKRMRSRFAYVEKAMGALLVLTGIGFLSGWVQTASYWLLEAFPGLGRLG